jgi:hypothetical protein
MEVIASLQAVRVMLKALLRKGISGAFGLMHVVAESIIYGKSTFESFVFEWFSYLWSIEVSEDLFFLLLLVIPTVTAYILDKLDREPSENEWANKQQGAAVAFKSPTLQSEEVWEKYDQLQKSKVISVFLSCRVFIYR